MTVIVATRFLRLLLLAASILVVAELTTPCVIFALSTSLAAATTGTKM